MLHPLASQVVRLAALALVFSCASAAQEHSSAAPERMLYEKGAKLLAQGRFELARLTLETLTNAYPRTAWRQSARAAIRESWIREGIANVDAMMLFQEGQTHAAAGRPDEAKLAWQTLVNRYPYTDFAGKVKARIRELDPPQ